MKIIKEAVAGTLESSDLLVKVAPGRPTGWTFTSAAK